MAIAEPTTHFWNAGGTDLITGQDVLGVREYDQNLEQEWVAGITTISLRARYMTLLPWVFGEFYHRHLDASGTGNCIEVEWQVVLTRLAFLCTMATNHGQRWGEVGRVYGTIGNRTFRYHLQEIVEKGVVVLPEPQIITDILDTYIMPCAVFGIVETNYGADKLPVKLTNRGQDIYEIRQHALQQNPLVDLLFSGGALTIGMLELWGHPFSLNGFDRAPEELQVLREAFFHPYHAAASVISVYRKFTQTVDWVLSRLEKSEDEDQLSDEVLARNYRDTVEMGTKADETARAWAEYELRRRIHFAQEVLMHAFYRTLRSEFADTGASIEQIVKRWLQMPIDPERIAQYCVSTIPTLMVALWQFADACNNQAFRPVEFPWGGIWAMNSAECAWYAMALLLTCRSDAERLDTNVEHQRLIPDPFRTLLFDILDTQREQPVSAVVMSVLEQAVVVAHLDTTMRKMGAGQKCSLRFYPESRVIHPLPNSFGAGISNNRLGSVMGMLADLGLCLRVENTSFAMDDVTKATAAPWRIVHET
ncbi:MAG TPA: hypothetical protein VHV83_02295 [Armatimonadota bacterium]|nr:hypothetical protein [Armatimonadota bacterium]